MMDRRGFLKLLGLGAGATAAGVVLPDVEPVRRFWQVGANAPVGRPAVARSFVAYDPVNDSKPSIFPGDPLYALPDGTVTNRPPFGGGGRPCGIATSADINDLRGKSYPNIGYDELGAIDDGHPSLLREGQTFSNMMSAHHPLTGESLKSAMERMDRRGDPKYGRIVGTPADLIEWAAMLRGTGTA